MKSVDHLVKIAERFVRKVSLAQTMKAQPGDIETALNNARVKPSPQDIAPLLNVAKVPEDVSLDIKISVDPKLNVKFLVAANPTHNAVATLTSLLDRKYSLLMTQALHKAKLQLVEPMNVNIATF